ncbi:alanine--tRNA ligase [Candidatus Endowatersipora endosymbiont of Watersipora subatra]|uniref:alanine--tRNA ligase n=1 Tax=Candidatus Endowatersipora endosymbiont of Watersipora subatra TaxID=3077946 RepID=UPI00312CAC2C
MNTVSEIRSAFLNYFEENEHVVLDSASLIPHNDSTLMFTAAGMVPFKNFFTGLETGHQRRVATSQKCLRAGGKHNDLDNVGYTPRHHTFFEMLGNFSFGAYFKAEAIELAWNLLTKVYHIDVRRLLITVFHEDDQAYDLWRKITGVSKDQIIHIAANKNFWSMSHTGPCGPCSEIFYDHGEHIQGGYPGSNQDNGDRFVEIWNLVFMQFDQISLDEKVPLPQPSIDTGMGLERIAAVLQGTHDNYEIDLFRDLIRNSEEITGVPSDNKTRASHRVIADHLRASSFLIADGILPSNEGRGYVLRRIMRRAMRHANLLGTHDPLLCHLVPKLIAQMGDVYPELQRFEILITETLEREEIRFRKTLSRGLKLLDTAASQLCSGNSLDGQTAFKLYDTYGFPLDLTQDALRHRGISVDVEEYNIAMKSQKREGSNSWLGSDRNDDSIWFSLRERHGSTKFVGYEGEKAEGLVLALVKEDISVDSVSANDQFFIVVNQTPFYGESGGQVGDSGTMVFSNAMVRIFNTQKKGEGLFVHSAVIDSGQLNVGDRGLFEVNYVRRSRLCSNHSATHLLHQALRQVLGCHVSQKGSLITPGRLRFDFSHHQPIDEEDLLLIHSFANRYVWQNNPVVTRVMGFDHAIKLDAKAQFGEKYSDEVRVVSMGRTMEGEKQGKPWSIELCGGTHVVNTGDIGLIKIVSESSVSSCVRRIEALTGEAALTYLMEKDKTIKEIAKSLKTSPSDVPARVLALVDDRKNLERELTHVKKQLIIRTIRENESCKTIGNFSFIGRIIEGVSPRDLRGLVDEEKRRLGSCIVALIAKLSGNKAAVVVGVTDDLTNRFNAIDLVRLAAKEVGGKGGGGRPNIAQAGGSNSANSQAALAALEAILHTH